MTKALLPPLSQIDTNMKLAQGQYRTEEERVSKSGKSNWLKLISVFDLRAAAGVISLL